MDLPANQNGAARDSMLFAPHIALRNNCALNLYIRVFLHKVNPTDDAAAGSYPDWDTTYSTGPRHGVNRRITRWPDGEFESWSARYFRECQTFWHGKFWLRTPPSYTDLDCQLGAQRIRPNIYCGFHLTPVLATPSAHHTIELVHLAADEPFFRSDADHYDNLDLDPVNYGPGLNQRAHIHEVGHLLGLGHSGESNPACVNNNPICYAGRNIMGQGEDIDATDALPWQNAIESFTGQSASNWTVSMSEILPRVLR